MAFDSTKAYTTNYKSSLTENQVLTYLQENPNFFLNHTEILSQMEIPKRWQNDKVADMQSFLLDRRSTEIDELRDCAQEVIETSRSNLSVQTRTHAAILSLIGTRNFDQFIKILNHDVPFYLDLDHISIGFEPFTVGFPELQSKEIISYERGAADSLIGLDKQIRIYPKIEKTDIFFSSSLIKISSGVLARIHRSDRTPLGILALGSKEDIFHMNQGTELINFLVRTVEILVFKYLGCNN